MAQPNILPVHPAPSSSSFDSTAFVSLVQLLGKTVQFSGDCSTLSGVPTTPEGMFTEAEKHAHLLPKDYQKAYSDPLLASKDALLKAAQSGELDLSILETLCGCIYERSKAHVAQPPLHRYQLVLDSLYDAFLNKEKQLKLNLPLIEKLSPLAMFQQNADAGPYTIPSDDIKQIIGGSVGVVSIPGAYMNHPILFVSLGHETGGHDVLHADAKFLPELASIVTSAAGPKYGPLWAYWIDETASDALGILNYGPAFTMNLGFFFGALNMTLAGGNQYLRTASGNFSGQLDPHPTDILRLGVGMGVINAMDKLSETTRSYYVGWLNALFQFCAGDTTEVKLQKSDGTYDSYPLSDFMASAVAVGSAIVSTSLKSLNGKSFSDIETWTDADESTAQDILAKLAPELNMARSALAASSVLPYDVEHLLAAASMAVLQQPTEYADITAAVTGQMDQMVTTDKSGLLTKTKYALSTLRKAVYKFHPRPAKPQSEAAPAVTEEEKASDDNVSEPAMTESKLMSQEWQMII